MTDDLVLADTTVWIHFLRGAGNRIQEKMVSLLAADRLATSAVIVMEILRGARSQKDFDKLRQDFAALRSLDVAAAVWDRAGHLAYALRVQGINVPLPDTLIAATALHYEALLLHDDRHYEQIAAVTSLRHEYLQPG